MRRYETVLLLNPELASEQLGEILERYQQMVGANAGAMLKLDDWGQRPLAYPVHKHTRAHYTLLDYCGEPRTVAELERNLRIDERCLKFLTVKTAASADPEAIREQLRQEAEARAAAAAAREAAEAAAREAAETAAREKAAQEAAAQAAAAQAAAAQAAAAQEAAAEEAAPEETAHPAPPEGKTEPSPEGGEEA
jgi:small subunit ribosomal protein S6